MITGRPPIPGFDVPIVGVEFCIDHGAALARAVLDAEILKKVVVDTIGPLRPLSGDEQLPEILLGEHSEFPFLRGVALAISEAGLTVPNRAKISRYERGEVTIPHTDNIETVDGITYLIPLVHGSEVWVHSDDWFEDINRGRVMNVSEYWPDDVMLCRQAIKSRNKKPTVHSSEIMSDPESNDEFRYLLSLDHVVEAD